MHPIPKVDVPEGRIGDYAVERFEVSVLGAAWFNTILLMKGSSRFITPGKYTRLVQYREGGKKDVIMSDTPAEIKEHKEAYEHASGRILVHGLGLGVIISACLQKPDVKDLTVIEKQKEIIQLVMPHYKKRFGNILRVIHDDALTYRPSNGKHYNMIWSDIWNDICPNNIIDMMKLKQIYANKCDWHGFWCEAMVREWVNRVCREYLNRK